MLLVPKQYDYDWHKQKQQQHYKLAAKTANAREIGSKMMISSAESLAEPETQSSRMGIRIQEGP